MFGNALPRKTRPMQPFRLAGRILPWDRIHSPISKYRRSALVCLTKKTAALKDEYDGVTKEIEDIYYKGFSDEEIEQFESYLKRILNNLGG